MNKDEAREIFEAVKANRAKIDGCARHRFEIGDPPYTFVRPILDWFEQREYAERMREAEQRAALEKARRAKCR